MTLELEYPTEDNFPNPFTPEFVSATAKEFKVDPEALAEALAAVAYDHAHARVFSQRFDGWRAARDRFEDTCRLLKKSLKSWQKATHQTKDAFASFGFNANLEEPLSKMIGNLEEILDFSTLPRGNPGKAHGTPGINLFDFTNPVKILDEFWMEQKGRHLGHGFHAEDGSETNEDDEGGQSSKNEKLIRRSADGDAGLLFAHKCLKKLDSKITRSNVSSCIRQIKKPRHRR